MTMTDRSVEIVTTGPADAVRAITEALVEERLAACGHLLDIQSTYRWAGKINHASEIRAAYHTTRARSAAVMRRITELHPYEVPCILVVDLDAVSPPYAAWIDTETTGHEPALPD
ncbi:MAG: divalent-cation tolerance protein CutA [Phycicoccus sp.]